MNKTTYPNATAYIVSEYALEKLSDDLNGIKRSLEQNIAGDLASTYIDSKSVPKLLKISQRTWQEYRNRGVIPFIQIGAKIWVKRSDIDAFMQSHYIKRAV